MLRVEDVGVRFPERFNLADYCLFDRLAEGAGGRIAIRFGERRYTYNDVANRSRALARFLVAAGAGVGDRVFIILPDTPAFAWSVFGTLKSGGVVVMGNPDAPLETLTAAIDLARPTAIITVPDVLSRLAPALDRENRRTSLKALLLAPGAATGEDPEAALPAPEAGSDPDRRSGLPLDEAIYRGRAMSVALPDTYRDDVAVWLFSSGSTGRPRAAMHAHRDLAFNAEVYARRTIGFRASDITLSVSRLYFGYATGTNLLFPLAVGAQVALFSEQPTPARVAEAIARYRPTIVTNVPTMIARLLEYDHDARLAGRPGVDLSSVRFSLSAGEALATPLYRRFVDRFGSPIYDGIGSAEMFHIFVTNRPGDVMPGSLGRPVEGYQVKLLPVDAEEPGAPEVADGEAGVLWVRGESVALGYARDRDASWATFAGRWCRTGDLFRRDAQGYLWLCGRADSLFKVCGQWVAPLEVEACLMDHPAVALAAVMPDPAGELVRSRALVVLRKPALAAVESKNELAAALRDHVARRLARHKVPRIIEFVADLPRNDRGKIDRARILRERAGCEPAAAPRPDFRPLPEEAR